MGSLGRKRYADPGTNESTVSRGTFQLTEPRQFQHAERRGVHALRCFTDGWSDYEYIYSFAAGSVRIEVTLVNAVLLNGGHSVSVGDLVFDGNFLCLIDDNVFDGLIACVQLEAEFLDGCEY